MRRWTRLALLFCCCLTAATAATATAQERPARPDARTAFDEGCRLAHQGKDARAHFARAAAAIEKHAGAHPSPEAFLNLGSAAFLADDVPRSIWAFRRGLALAPQHRLLREHLDYARAQVALPREQNGQPEPDPWPAWLPRWSGCTWLTLAATGYTGVCAAAAVWLLYRRRGLLAAAGAFLGITALGGYAWLVGTMECRREARTPVVVIKADDTALYTGNGPSYPTNPDLPRLYAGMEARRLAERGGWLQIQFAGGEIGWVAGRQVLIAAEPE